MHRRTFIQTTVLAAAGTAFNPLYATQLSAGKTVMTVLGPIAASDLGITLVHEHVMTDFIGADKTGPARYNQSEVIKTVLPYLNELKAAGCDTMIECTPAYVGRDAGLLKQLSKASKLNIVTNTGYYGAGGNHKFIPKHGFTESASQLAKRWIAESKNGIENCGVHPGFIKISGENGPITPMQRKLVEAAAITHLQTGLTVAMHTGDGKAAEEEVKILESGGVAPDAFVWVHAQNEQDTAFHIRLAKQGAWIEFDSLNPESLTQYVDFVLMMKENKLLHRTLISHDAGWYHVGEAGGGNFRGFTLAFNEFIPALIKKGITKTEVEQLFRTNPAEAFAMTIRKR